VELVMATVVMKLSNELLETGVITTELLTQHQFSALVLMAFITTLMAPISLKMAIARTCGSEKGESFCKYVDESNLKSF